MSDAIEHRDDSKLFELLKEPFLYLVTPKGTENAYTLLRVRLLLGALLCFLAASVLPIVLIIFHGADVVYIVPSLAVTVAYIVGRFFSYRLAGHLLVAVATASPIFIVLSNIFESDRSVFLLLFFNMSLVASLLATLIYGIRLTLIVIVVNVTIFLIALLSTPLDLPPNASTIPIVIDTFLIAMLIMTNMFASHSERHHLRRIITTSMENRKRLEDLLQQSPDLITIRAGGRYVYINQNGASLLGIENVEEILHTPHPDFEVKADDEDNVQLRRQMDDERMSIRYRGQFRRVDGSIIEADIVNSVVIYANEVAKMTFARPIDVASPDVMTDDTSQAQAMLLQSALRQATIAELGMLALNADDAGSFFEHVSVLVSQTLGVACCCIYRYDKQTPQLAHFTHLNLETPSLVGVPQKLVMAGTLFEDMVRSIDVAMFNDSLRPPQVFLEQGWEKGACLPIFAESQPYGVLLVLDATRHFDGEAVYFLQSIANLLSSFITMQRTQAKVQRQRQRAEIMRDATTALNQHLELDAILTTTIHYIKQILPNYGQSLLLIMNDRGELRFGAFDGFSEPEATRAIFVNVDFSVAPLIKCVLTAMDGIVDGDVRDEDYDDIPDWVDAIADPYPRSFLGVPVMLGEQCMGILMIYAFEPYAFTDENLEHLREFADKVANALQNARLKAELEIRVRERTQQFRQERQQLQAILDATGEGIVYTEDGLILFANQSMGRLLGYPQQSFIGRSLISFLPTETTAEEAQRLGLDARHTRRGQTWRQEVNLQRADGKLLSVDMTLSSLDGGGDNASVVIIMRDISEQKALEEQKARFISTAAHELRSPITTLNTRLYLMKRKPQEIETVHLPILERSVGRINRLVSDLLDLSSFDQGQLPLQRKMLVVQEVLQEVYEMEVLRAESNAITLRLDLPTEPISVLGDPDRLYQVFDNLVVNAIHYTPQGGRVTLRLKLQGDEVHIEVEDTGKGIASEDMAQIFRPFFRAVHDKQGTGLGLPIAHEIVNLHGGRIEVASAVGQGSTFTVILPSTL